MPAEWCIEPLTRAHERARFRCGEPALDEYLACYARQNQESGVARTFVAVSDREPTRIVGYYSLAMAGLDKANLPPEAAKRFPDYPVTVARLARLAVDISFQGRGLGEDLLLDALRRCLKTARDIGLAAVLVDAKHARARDFYMRYEFKTLPHHPLTLWLPVATLRRIFGEA